ncbi:hypothetical protein PF004_g31955 [Phytophthora fragariae]|uniref:DDE Tnp4 domain-containing protein n=1 Tax=Phytophthora fragariae TaxID=53985 RepID=A0A6G0M8A2_9STRA|nr:hypothetical protein PF004_g31955 [Phytophthora fragariae]
MDKRTVVVVCAVVASACATAAAVAAGDKRGHGSERCRVSTFSSTTFEQALEAKETDWFRKKLRCDKASFLLIYRAIYAACPQKPAANAKHKLIQRVALIMYYLAQGGQMDQAGMPLGISHTRSVVYINEMLDVLCSMDTRYICMPTEQELESVELGFEAVTGFPNVVGAIDGTLVPIQRPKDFEGWYCRKMFPAVNVQAVVDHVGSFRSLSICAGSNNDQSLWNGSAVKKR